LHQEDERSVGVETYRPYLDLGMVVMKAGYGFLDYVTVSSQHRESHIELLLQPGSYLVVPISGGTVFRRDYEVEEHPLLTPSGEFHPIFQSTLKDIFRKYDRDMDQVMDCQQFLDFISRIGVDFDEKRFYSVIMSKYTSTDAGITLQGFYEMFYVAFEQFGETSIRKWLTKLGYDEQLFSIESRAVVASFHSNAFIDVIPESMTDDFLLTA
jgi:hypothetical protein